MDDVRSSRGAKWFNLHLFIGSCASGSRLEHQQLWDRYNENDNFHIQASNLDVVIRNQNQRIKINVVIRNQIVYYGESN